jgi:hypothetical protein
VKSSLRRTRSAFENPCGLTRRGSSRWRIAGAGDGASGNEALAPVLAARLQYFASGFRRHPLPEPVGPLATDAARLVGETHAAILLPGCFPGAVVGAWPGPRPSAILGIGAQSPRPWGPCQATGALPGRASRGHRGQLAATSVVGVVLSRIGVCRAGGPGLAGNRRAPAPRP